MYALDSDLENRRMLRILILKISYFKHQQQQPKKKRNQSSLTSPRKSNVRRRHDRHHHHHHGDNTSITMHKHENNNNNEPLYVCCRSCVQLLALCSVAHTTHSFIRIYTQCIVASYILFWTIAVMMLALDF